MKKVIATTTPSSMCPGLKENIAVTQTKWFAATGNAMGIPRGNVLTQKVIQFHLDIPIYIRFYPGGGGGGLPYEKVGNARRTA